MTPRVASWSGAVAARRLADYAELGKPRVVVMVLFTTFVGYYLGATGAPALGPLAHALFGTALAAAGTMALNQYLEREVDARMERTRRRPLPDGRVSAGEAFALGLCLVVGGVGYLAIAVNALAASVTAVIAVTYLALYTPLKRVTSFCSIVGAIPGALPPVAGWAAAQGRLGIEAWVLFAIMFLWQIPHTLAIGQVYRDDYARAGIRVLPVIDYHGGSTGRQAVLNTLALLAVGLLPTFVGLAGAWYFIAALLLGLGFLWSAITLARTHSVADARRLLFARLPARAPRGDGARQVGSVG
jgi:protoheme IX farnesyltransferase